MRAKNCEQLFSICHPRWGGLKRPPRLFLCLRLHEEGKEGWVGKPGLEIGDSREEKVGETGLEN